MQLVRWQALSYSATLPPVTAHTREPLSLLSSHDHAVNLCTADGKLIALVTPYYDNGPFHIVVSTPHLPQFHLHTKGQCGAGILALDHIHIALAAATRWDPQLPLLQIPAATALSSLCELSVWKESALTAGPPAQSKRAQAGILALGRGITTKQMGEVGAGVAALAGLGPGLTPAGDDFLVGVLAALSATAHQGRAHGQARGLLATQIATLAATRTTRLSAAWLRHAGQGHFAERWHDLIHALNQSALPAIEQAVARLAATGATSGADGLYGFVTGLGWQ